MPYIPKRTFEDKPDIYTPFVPIDPDTKTECVVSKSEHIPITKSNNYLFYIVLFLLVYYSLKQYKII